ncbi:MAG: hypothetical protein COV74_05615 [Candidatus Omnitrophica bacterium CG11_big_fil_rev_8_21_14_0_20_45_26]|uniref:Type II secretion system protein GspF domain-containing protein n=1 Tax=Candidatus Abzuiibacterium crystallinum TaxID=1974748 RepID=A0A2H0LP39_9BACT|nr:MAG: hypothetical protein COV74_05615 [Candidatus Omnitrophica bacterium CG11_big_fil_rev_8_21_14_0_20_45_26]PIW65273.1 MAG: hypothetical protein COW12_02745 [Candidatus Omnitrophica bacterium CG12_big_fil_rev_8_21_14_0_65_45_16]
MAHTFIYQAKDSHGKVVQGSIVADSENQAFQKLSAQGYFPLSLNIQKGKPKAQKKPAFRFPKLISSGKVTARELADLFDHLAILLNSGFPVLKCLQLVNRQTQNPVLGNAIEQIVKDIQVGTKLSESIGEFPKIFPATVAGAIQAGEASGQLDLIFSELAKTFHAEAELRGKVAQTLVYPVFVTCFGILTVFFVMTFIVPKLTVLFDSWEQKLPLPTRMMMALSYWFTHGLGAVLILGIAALLIYWRRLDRTQKMAMTSMAVGKIPFFQSLLFLSDFVPLARTWGLLLKSGVPLMESIRIAQSVVANTKFRKSLGQISKQVVQGASLSETIQRAKLFPEMAINFIQVGEESGGLDIAFERIAVFYERELNEKLKVVTSLLEPILILIVGLGICFIVLSLLLPIFEINLLAQ